MKKKKMKAFLAGLCAFSMVLSGVSVSAAPDNTGTETSGESQDIDQSVTLDNEEPDATEDVTAGAVQEQNPEENQTNDTSDDTSDGTAESAKESTEDPGAGITWIIRRMQPE